MTPPPNPPTNISDLLDVFDQLPAFTALQSDLEKKIPLNALDLPKAARPAMLARIVRDFPGPVLFVTARIESVPIWQQELESWLGDSSEERLLRFPEPTPLPYDRAPWSNRSRQGRLTVFSRLIAGQHPLIPATSASPVIVTSARALLQPTVPKRNFLKSTRVLRLGQLIDLTKLEETWQGLGYERVTVVERPGQFSQRGGIVDIFPAGGTTLPIRIELFGDEIDTLRSFDPATQRSAPSQLPPPERVLIPPAREAIPADSVELGQVFQLDAPPKEDDLPAWQDDIPTLAAGQLSPHGEFYLPLIYSRPDSLLHYLPSNGLLVIDDWIELQQMVADTHQQAEKLREEAPSLPPGYPTPLLLWQELEPYLNGDQRLILGAAVTDDERSNLQPATALAEAFNPGPRYGGQMRPFMYQLSYVQRQGEPTVVVSRQAQRLESLWLTEQKDRDIPFTTTPLINGAPPSIQFINSTLSEGFVLERSSDNAILLNLLTDAEIFGWNRPTPRRRTRPQRVAPETYFSDLAAGDYIVHTEYGIGQFQGLVVRSIGGADREYLKIEYANSDILYEPVHHADRLSKWIGSEDFAPGLNRLGDKRWTAAKKKAQRDINELADELLELYAQRETVSGHAFSQDQEWQMELEASFPYQETEDQLHAIAEVKADMERSVPMDRLICGDVGFGKTEVALRAAFKAVNDGKQVAILVPTTVLAQQHTNTFKERLSPFPVTVGTLSRFLTASKQRQVIQQLQNGAVDIVIGTHRLFSDDVRFKDLGLLIIDEEQRFGVSHKEKIKQLRTEVDVLTMTATPIPRTMHMALSGLRDISTISTAPTERLPVQTYVGEMEDQLVRRAILRELERSGQIYFVHNRVQTIATVAKGLQDLVPEAIIGIGHGQMSERELEKVMASFADGEIDILVATTIIESGLDIPNANTLIVNQADQFGLAQLYQLRGRVGRGAHRAYAYFFHGAWRKLTPEAKARLETIAETTELGSGYTIAMRDLEIRGSGELLGPNQSGHIAAIGFDLYTRMLARAVSVRKSVKEGATIEMELPDTTLIDLPLATYIPNDYVPDAALRLRLYRRMAVLNNLEEIESMVAELGDRFGPLPDPLENLLYQLRVKVLSLQAGVTSVTTELRQIKISYPGLMQLNRIRLQHYLGSTARVSRTGIWLRRDMPTREWQIALIQILEKLASYRQSRPEKVRTNAE